MEQPGLPSRFREFLHQLPILNEVIDAEPLRRWALSEVWRVRLRSGDTLICKWGGGSMGKESDIYENLFLPLAIRVPQIVAGYRYDHGNVLVMEDLGAYTVEQCPTEENILSATRMLASLRRTAATGLQNRSIPPNAYDQYLVTADYFPDALRTICPRLTQAGEVTVLERALEILQGELAFLYESTPMTITHNDFNLKNLMIADCDIVPIDWSNACLSPYMGDLYCLMREAEQHGKWREAVVEAYRSIDPQPDLMRQIWLGGACWLIRGLDWVTAEGVHIIPGCDQWIPDMIGDLDLCVRHVRPPR
ncbi:MAG: phosphotransferase [Bacilli bacterium]